MEINCNIDSIYIKYIDELILLATSRDKVTFNGKRAEININFDIVDNDVTCIIDSNNGQIIYRERFDELKLLLKRVVFKGLSELLKRPLSPWGILTGVRPTKVIQGFIEDGLRKEEIIRELEDNYLVDPEKIAIMYRVRQEQNFLGYSNSLHLYIGIPFCPSRCSYCSFTSYTIGKSKSLIEPYLAGLIKEIEFWGQFFRAKGVTLASIYIGGGTPSSLEVNQIGKLLAAIKRNFNLSTLLEYTFEGGRPDTLSTDKLKTIKKHGVTRISINPQTTNNKTLSTIGRTHSKDDFVKVFNKARELGFDWINTDLIIGLENEGYEEYSETINQIVSLKPENITVHSLALKRAATQKEKSSLEFEEAKKIMDLTYSVMDRHGYCPYYLYRQKSMAGNQENVGFSQRGYASPYNVVSIEENSSVIALGCGAISKVVKNGSIVRYANPKDPNQYLKRQKERGQRDVPFAAFLSNLEEYLDTCK